ncbi:sodium-dependent multivitamin transporter-like isoform X2 [Gordionus sp. m RMFG-2023]|uniref:sodium-dependent multivitamin transporter-like isoform X2 n=1 Tax=Gordionus sp. m RMFG-2023 TaxID=3053472 RepID=UPI0031FBDCBE
MTFSSLSNIDYLVILFFLIITCSIGIYYAWKDRHSLKLDNAFVGNRKFKMFPIACSLLVTQISAILILGMPAEFYTRGAQYWVYIVAQWLGVIVATHTFVPVFCKVGEASSFNYIQQRFHSPTLRSYCALTFVLTQLLYASVVLFAPCLAISLMVPIPINTLLLIIGGICTFYTAIGGFKTVIATDLFQFLVIFAAIIGLMIKGIVEVGSIKKVYGIAGELGRLGETFDFNPDPTRYQSVWTIFLGIFFLTLRSYGIYQPSVQRYVSMPNFKRAKKSILIVLPMQLILIFVLSTLGFVMLAAYKFCDPLTLKIITKKDLLLSVFAMQSFQKIKGLNGLFLACLFSGSLSTLSSSFNSLAAVTWEDFTIPLFPKFANRIMKRRGFPSLIPAFLAMSFGLIVIGISFLAQNVEGILNAALFALSVFGGQALAVFFLGMFVRSANYKGVITGKFVADLFCVLITCGFMKYGKLIVPPYLPVNTTTFPTSLDNLNYSLGNLSHANDSNHLFNLTGTSYCHAFFIKDGDRMRYDYDRIKADFNKTGGVGGGLYNDSIFLTVNALNRSDTNEMFMTPIGNGLGNFILFKLYSISYLLLTPLGFLICTLIGILVSKVTGGVEKDKNLKYDYYKLLHPWLLRQEYTHE